MTQDLPDDPVVRIPATPAARPRRRIGIPVLLFLATCASTYVAGGWAFFLAVMTILTAHELGHFFQAVRYRVPASLPYFIPMPLSPFGTLGAVIAMHPGMGNRRALFDIAITGPLAGLVPALAFSVLGLMWSEVLDPVQREADLMRFGVPLLFQWLIHGILGPLPEGHIVALHPVGFAGWVGIFITALNLIPIGQLDGGHILYALLRTKAYPVATALLAGAAVAVVVFGYWHWMLMLLLLLLIGPIHPPTANDYVPLGRVRVVLGWVTLLFVLVGFTPTPLVFDR